MTKEEMKEKMDQSAHDCMTCEFKVVPIKIEPCKSCNDTQDNWKPNRLFEGLIR